MNELLRLGGTGASGELSLLRPIAPDLNGQAVAALYLIAVTGLGTGGVSSINWERATARTGLFSIVREGMGPAEETFTASDQVLLLRRWLSLSVAEAARILQVQRPTIYSWQGGAVPPAPKNLERLRSTFDFAQKWRSMSAEPVGAWRKEPLGPGGRTLLELLSADGLSEGDVMRTLTRIAETRDRHAERRPASGAELAKRFGFSSMNESEVIDNIDSESSRTSHEPGHL